MTTVEVLAPLRIETRFVSPAERTDGSDQWMLRLRVYPDEFSIRHDPQPPSTAELDALTAALASMSAPQSLSKTDAFGSFAGTVGASRALGLWRGHVVTTSGTTTVSRTGEVARAPRVISGPAGVPESLEVWAVETDGSRNLLATMAPKPADIAADLDLEVFAGSAKTTTLPETWWLSFARAKAVGLGAEIDIGTTPPEFDALVVLGIGDADAADLVTAHNTSGRMAVLAQGTPTNTVAGEPTTDFGDDATTVAAILGDDPTLDGSATSLVLEALAGAVPPGALPMLGGGESYGTTGATVVAGLWPVLWGHYLRDVIGIGGEEHLLLNWASEFLAVQGPRPAIRIGDQPYGLLPTSAFSKWVDPGGVYTASSIEQRVREWALAWRPGAAASARATASSVNGASTDELLENLGLSAPNQHWRGRAIWDANALQTLRVFGGGELLDPTWGALTSEAFRGTPYPVAPAGPAPGEYWLPESTPPHLETADELESLIEMNPQSLLANAPQLGLVGHLIRESMIAMWAISGQGYQAASSGARVDLGAVQPWDEERIYRGNAESSDLPEIGILEASSDPGARILARQYHQVNDALHEFVKAWKESPVTVYQTVLAALDTASFRVDPWLTGIAEHRLQDMISASAPFKLGAYGWVDAPAPFSTNDALAPGPTSAGLLHAPSPAQAMTAALLRDAAIRYPNDPRWNLTVDSAKVRAAVSLGERVRLGLHPYEALGLEVERIAGDWDVVRTLRDAFPLAPDQNGRRVCDGQQVLAAARANDARIPADLATALVPLDEVLDTYADLLVADGIFSLVTGHAETANAAMEAAAGLGAPPDLRSIRTPREATTVRVGAWALLGPGAPGTDQHPATIADPAFAAQLTADFGAAPTDDERRAFAALFGGAEERPPLPTLVGGSYEGLSATADDALRAAIATDLTTRLARLTKLATAQRTKLAALDPAKAASATALATAALRWSVPLDAVVASDPMAGAPSTADTLAATLAELDARIATSTAIPAASATAATEAWIDSVRASIRTLVGHPELPVLPIVARSLLPKLRTAAAIDAAWLEVIAAVRPRLAVLEAHQLGAGSKAWKGAVAAPGKSTDPWHATGPVLVAYGPGVGSTNPKVALAALDGWTDSVPSRYHTTSAVFGFNAPKSRAPQAVLLAVPPDPATRLDNAGLLDVILETRELVQARAAQPVQGSLPFANSTAMVNVGLEPGFFQGWPTS